MIEQSAFTRHAIDFIKPTPSVCRLATGSMPRLSD
jgi:hypothetical protein